MQILGVGSAEIKLDTPTFSATTAANGGWTATITNYDAANTYTLSTTSGSVSRTGSTITASGLSNGSSSTVSVYASQTGFATSSTGTVTGTSIPSCSTCTYAFTTTEGGNCGTCFIFGNNYIVCYDIYHYTGSPNPCIGCNAAIGSWYACSPGGYSSCCGNPCYRC